MKIILNKQDQAKLRNLLERNSININIADMLLYAFENRSELGECDNKEEYLEQLFNLWELDNSKENKDLINKHVSLEKADEAILLNNDFYKQIKTKNIKKKEYEIYNDSYAPFELIPLDDIDVDEDYNEISKVGYFSKNMPFLAVNLKNITWMSINPNEINTMRKSIENAHGKVLVGGLGLGYYPYMISNKENVKEIFVIEKDVNIIELFKNNILPQYKNKAKIKIINSDFFSFLRNTSERFDYAFIDLWHNPEDGLPLYIKCLKHEAKFTKCEFTYWIEKSLLAMLRRCMFTLIEEQNSNLPESNYKKSKSEIDKVINGLFFLTKNKSITSYQEIHDMLSDANLKLLARKITL